MSAAPLLEVRALRAGYGRTEVLRNVTMTIAQGEIVALLGSNGAGKSTLNRTISGILRPRTGEILFDAAPIAGRPPREIVSRGLIHVPEGRKIFPNMTVSENIDLGSYRRAAQRRAPNRERVFAIFPRNLRARCPAASNRCWRSAAA
jgi:branched-chain amino acid transport system ATP-binding protein